MKRKKMISLVTHGGMYHADDILATALLEIILKGTVVYEDNWHEGDQTIPLVRVTDWKSFVTTEDDIVYDIGLGEFDHHQKNKEIRENGIPYAALGLLWKRFAETQLGFDPEIAKMVDEDFVQYIDQTDNGGQAKFPNTVSALVSAQFKAGVDFIDCVHQFKPMLEALINSYKELNKQRVEILQLIKDSPKGNLKRIFLGGDTHFDGRVFKGTEVKFVTGPSLRGPGVVLRSLDSENYPIVDVEGITPSFIHTGRFTATYASEEEALAVAKESIKIGEEKEGEIVW